MINEHDFNIRLLEVFRTESREHRQTILSVLRVLEQGVDAGREAEAVAQALRAAHTLKGAARVVNKSQIALLCQSFEGIFSLVKNGRGPIGKEMFGVLYETVDRIETLEAGAGEGDSDLYGRLNETSRALERPGKEVPDG
jgi:chemotaxis protein histidine kinase CheA